jgi:hypothetical protein
MSRNGWHKEEQIIEALIRSSNVSQASTLCNVSGRTIRRYLSKPEFKERLRLAKAQLLEDAIDELRRENKGFARVLANIAHSDVAPHAARVSAARSGLQIAIDAGLVQDVANRLEALEAKAPEDTARWRSK